MLTALGISLFALAGCQNPYSQFYTNRVPADRVQYLLPHTGETQYFSATSTDMRGESRSLISRGYVPIGNASFEARAGDYSSDLHQRAKELQADVVLVSSSYARTQSGAIPVMTYQPGQTSTTYTSGQVHTNSYGNGYGYGSANYSGTSTTTSPGTYNTEYIPYSVARNNYTAVFFRRNYFIFGATYNRLDDEQRRMLQRNTGIVVDIVVEGTPAFAANILPGDILLTIDGDPIVSTDWISNCWKEKAGQIVKVGILRNGTEKVIELRLNPPVPTT